MATREEAAILSLVAYPATSINDVQLPSADWRILKPRTEGTMGFGYAVFKNDATGEVVVAFRGTLKSEGSDWMANAGLTISQERQAAQVVAEALRDHGGDITVVGHSLGGGLASTMAVWFDLGAIVFDPSPAQSAATDVGIVNSVIGGLGTLAPQTIKSYAAAIPAVFPDREGNVVSYSAQGSALQSARTDANSIIGSGQDHADFIVGLTPGERHSQELLVLSSLEPDFADATVKVPSALSVLFDPKFYRTDPRTSEARSMVRELIDSAQATGGGKLTAFTADLHKLGDEASDLSVAGQKAIVAQCIEWYYWQGVGYEGEQFLTVTNHVLQFTSAIGSGLSGAQYKAGGYIEQWLHSYLPLEAVQNSSPGRMAYDHFQQWNVAASGGQASALDANKTQIFLGSAQTDTFLGGNLGDLLLGGAGDDVLDGGSGKDFLYGGAGSDIYRFAGSFGQDVIADADGLGTITIDGAALTGGKGAGANTWVGKDTLGRVEYYKMLDDASSSTGRKLVITREDGTGGAISITNFDLSAATSATGYLGIKLEVAPRVALLQGAADYFWRTAEATLDSLTGRATTLLEKSGTTFTLSLDFAAKAGETLVLSLANLANKGIKAILGDVTVDANGAVITLEEGQTQVSFALVQDGGLDADASGSLKVNFVGDGRDAQSNTWGLGLDADDGFTRTINGDYTVATGTASDAVWRQIEGGTSVTVVAQGGTVYNWDADGNLVASAGGTLVTHNTLYGTTGNDAINGRTGNDLLGGGAGADRLDGGDGDDMIGGGTGNDTLIGGLGNDFISSASNPHPMAQQYGPSDLWSSWGSPAGAVVLASGMTWGVYRLGGQMHWGGMNLNYMDQQSDYIDAGAGNDAVIASWGNDHAVGGEGQDTLAGLAGDDVIEGNEGDDDLSGDGAVTGEYELLYAPVLQHGSDFLDGGAGDDTLEGGGRADRLFGGIDDDRIYGDSGLAGDSPDFVVLTAHGNDYLDGEDGNDYLEGNGGQDTLYGGAGVDTLWGDTDVVRYQAALAAQPNAWGQDYLDGEDGNDILIGGGNDDTLFGGEGDDAMHGDQDDADLPGAVNGADYLDGEGGADTLLGGGGNDTLYGGAGNDVMTGDDQEAHVAGAFQGNDYLDGEEGDDDVRGGGGNDTVWGGAGDDILYGDEVEQSVSSAFHGDDYVAGEDGNDHLAGGGGRDTLAGGDGNDTLDGGAGLDYLVGGAGQDMYVLDSEDDIVIEEDDDSRDDVEARFDYTLGDNLDNLVFTTGAGNLKGTGNALDNSLIGNEGNNVLTGAGGNDVSQGKEGNDVYAFGRGDGADNIDNYDFLRHLDDPARPQAVDVLRFASGVSADDVVAGQQGNHLFFRVRGTGETVLVQNHYAAAVQVGRELFDWAIDRVEFADGTAWNAAQIQAIAERALSNMAPSAGSASSQAARAGDFFSYQFPANAITDPNAWDRVAYSLTRADGSALPSWLSFDAASLALGGLPGAGDVGSLALRLWGEDGYGAKVFSNFTITVGQPSVAPSLATPLVDQTITQGAGFSFTVPDGAFADPDIETLYYYATLEDGSALPSWLHFDGATRTFSGSATADLGNLNVRVTAWDRSMLTTSDVFQIVLTVPHTTGTAGADTLNGGAGDDIIEGLGGADVLSGNAGNDLIFGGTDGSRDTMNGGDGNDQFFGYGDVDTGAGNDLVDATGWFYLRGGDDTVLLRMAYEGTVRDIGIATGQKTLRFMDGVRPQDVAVTRDYDDLVLRWGGYDSDPAGWPSSMRLNDFFVSSVAGMSLRVEFQAVPGTVWSAQALLTLATTPTAYRDRIDGGEGADAIDGLQGNDWLDGRGGNDSLYGSAGDDNLDGGAGDDLLAGGSGSNWLAGGTGIDTYVIFEDGNSTRTIVEAYDGGVGALDIVLVRGGVRPEDILAYRSYQDLVLKNRLTGEVVQLSGIFVNPSAPTGPIAEVRFEAAPGTVWTWADLKQLAMTGNEYNNTLGGFPGHSSTIAGAAGDDILSGSYQDDRLDGGPGLDRLAGGSGDDTYLFGADSGIDYIVDTSGANVLQFKAGIVPADVRLLRTALTSADVISTTDSLVIVVNSTGARVHLDEFFQSATAGTAQIRFADNTVWNFADVVARLQPGGTADGMSGSDTYNVDNSADYITESAGGGYDIVNSTVSYRLSPEVEELRLLGPNAFNGTGNSGANVLRGNELDNVLRGGGGADAYHGGAGNDVYFHNGVRSSSAHMMFQPVTPNVVENAGEGVDTLFTDSFAVILPDNVERLAISDFIISGDLAGSADAYTYTGNALDNVIDVSAGDFTHLRRDDGVPLYVRVDGGAGADTLIGGNGNVVYIVDNVGDHIFHASDNPGQVEASVSYTLQQGLQTLILAGNTAIDGTGNGSKNTLDGARNTAANQLSGLGGDDLYLVGLNDTIVEAAGGGADSILLQDLAGQSVTTVDLAQWQNVENLELALALGDITVVGDDGANEITGSLGSNRIEGRGGDDRLQDFNIQAAGPYNYVTGYDLLDGGSGNDSLSSYGGQDTLLGGSGDDVLYASNAFWAVLDGGAGNDRISLILRGSTSSDYGLGTVHFDNGSGQDVVSTERVRSAADWASTRQVLSAIALGPAADLGALQLQRVGADLKLSLGTADNLTVRGFFSDTLGTAIASSLDSITLADGSVLTRDVLAAWIAQGAPRAGTTGDDITVANAASGQADGGAGNDYVLGRGGQDSLQGGIGDDTLFGAGGDDELRGGAGNDLLVGGGGDDTYYFSLGWGADRIDDFQRSENFHWKVASERHGAGENAVVFDSAITTADIAITQDGGDLLLTHRSSGDSVRLLQFFDGDPGVDAVRFADGTVWDRSRLGELAVEVSGTPGADVLQALPDGGRVLGLGGNDQITGSAFSDYLDGGTGVDTMTGGLGDDTFLVDVAGDDIRENSNQGFDTVYASLNWTLLPNFEALLLLGTGNLEATGNSAANDLWGNDGNNKLDGKGGADYMAGGLGNDRYIVDNVNDQVWEGLGEGLDTVESSVSFTLAEEVDVENLTLTGTSNIGATGNALDNVLTGNSGANTLRGKAGNDTYVISTNDAVTELEGEGVDTIQVGATYSLATLTHVENLTLTGTGNFNATGNAQDNVLTGNSGTNTLTGGAGNDTYVISSGDTVTEVAGQGIDTIQAGFTFSIASLGNIENLTLTGTGAINATGNALANTLRGNSGSNVLTGSAGNDSYRYGRGGGQDSISDNDATANNLDQVVFDAGIAVSAIQFLKVGNDLVLKIAGTSEQVTVTSHFSSAAWGVEEVRFADSPQTVLTRANITSIVNGSGFANHAPAAGQAVAQQNVVQGQAWSFQVPANAFADVDAGDTLAYAAARADGSALPEWLQFDAATRTFSGTASAADLGALDLRLTVTDRAGESVTTTFSVAVAEPTGVQLSGSGSLAGSAYADQLTATGYGTQLQGLGGDDVLGTVASGAIFDLVFEGGAGNDTITGSYARDIYRFKLGDGRDVIVDDVRSLNADVAAFFAAHPDTATYQDRLEFGAGITAASVARTRAGNDLVLTLAGGADSVTVKNWFDGTVFNQLEAIAFADGSTWTAADADAGLGQGVTLTGSGTLNGTPYADTLRASGNGARLVGSAGNDTLGTLADGAIFDLVFQGGRGNDTITGSYARDFYKFNLGDGQDTITDDVRSLNADVAAYFAAHPDTATYQDQLDFGEGIAAAGVARSRSGNDLVLALQGADSVTVRNWFDGTPFNKLEVITFADGTVWTAADAEAGLVQEGVNLAGSGTLNGTAFSDTLAASGYGTQLNGLGGADTLQAQDNGSIFDLVFTGGAGNDILRGSYARDFYRFQAGDGQDTISDDVRSLNPDVAAYFAANPGAETYQDRLEFGAGIAWTGVTLQQVDDDLVLNLGGGDRVTVDGWFDGTVFRKIEQFQFADASAWTAAEAERFLASGGAWGTQVGSGTVQGTANADTLKASAYGTSLIGGAGNDQLQALVDGGIFDVLFRGGTGDDSFIGSYARDFYHFDRGDGNDTIRDDVRSHPSSGVWDYFAANPTAETYQDHLLFGTGITPQDVSYERVGDDIVFSVANGGGSVVVQDWYDGTVFNKIELIGFENGTVWNGASL